MKITEFTGGYEVKSHRELRSGAFECDLFQDGRKILHVTNDGRGGSNLYQPVTGNVGHDFRASLDALVTFAENTGFDSYEPADMFVDALAMVKQIGAHSKRHSISYAEAAQPLLADITRIDREFYAATIALIRRVAEEMAK